MSSEWMLAWGVACGVHTWWGYVVYILCVHMCVCRSCAGTHDMVACVYVCLCVFVCVRMQIGWVWAIYIRDTGISPFIGLKPPFLTKK